MPAAPLLLALVLSAGVAANPYLDEARDLYGKLRFRDALAKLEVARQVPTHDRGQKLQILELLARCHVAEGERAEAEAAFAEMLSLDPRVTLDRGLSPKILEAFDAAKARLFAPDYLVLKQLPSPPGLGRVELVDPWKRAQGVLVFRRPAGALGWQRLPLRLSDGVGMVSLSSPTTPSVEWYAVAVSSEGGTLTQLGSAEGPLTDGTAPAPGELTGGREPERRGGPDGEVPQWRKTAPWAASAVAAAALGAGLFLQARSRESEREARAAEWVDESRQHHSDSLQEARFALGMFAGAGLAGAGAAVLFFW